MSGLRIYCKHIRIHLLSGLEYRGWWMSAIQSLLFCVFDPLGMVLLFHRFGNIGAWTVERLLLIYAMAVASYRMAQLLFQGFEQMPMRLIRTGDFDRLLLRPRSLFVQTAASFFYIHRFSGPTAGIAVILWCLWRQGVRPTPVNAAILVMALLGGTAAYAGVLVLTAGIAFFSIKALEWNIVFTNASYQITRIPHEYIPVFLKRIFTFVMPMLVVCYYPASVVCGWGEHTWTAFLALPAGLAFLGVAALVWRVGVRHYKSTGS